MNAAVSARRTYCAQGTRRARAIRTPLSLGSDRRGVGKVRPAADRHSATVALVHRPNCGDRVPARRRARVHRPAPQ